MKNELREDLLQQFYENEPMRNAVRELLVNSLSVDIALKKDKDKLQFVNNEILGASVRARAEGLKLIEQAFEELSRYKKVENKVENLINQAR